MSRKQKMSFKDAMDLVPDDLPDGAFWAMAHEIAGLEYGEGFGELADADYAEEKQKAALVECPKCKRLCKGERAWEQHFRAKHPDDHWPTNTKEGKP